MTRLLTALLCASLLFCAGHADAAKPKKKPAASTKKKTDYVGESVNFREWKAVSEFEDEMVAKHGFTRAEMDELVGKLRFVDSAIQLVKPAPPGKPKNWAAYTKLIIDQQRIDAGVQFWNENATTLERAEEQYGVPAEIIAGIIGVETFYGRITGRFRVLDVLFTLAFAYPETPNKEARMLFFRGEAEQALLFARKYHIDPLSVLGSFAGAVGLPQFMPSNILLYGVDYDGDGQIDLRNSPTDAIGSVANFLVQHGWQREQPGAIVYAAQVSPARAWEKFIGAGLSAQFTLEQMKEAGVTTGAVPPEGQMWGLVDLQNGADPTEYWLASNNFFTITQYNRSYFYAMSVVDLGRAIRASRETFLKK